MQRKSRKQAKPDAARRPPRDEAGGARRRLFRYVGPLALVAGVAAAAVWLASIRVPPLTADRILAAYDQSGKRTGVEIRYPRNHSVFPPEIVPPTFHWDDIHPDSDGWLIRCEFADGQPALTFTSDRPEWTPPEPQWQTVKDRSSDGEVTVTIVGVNRRRQSEILSAGEVAVSTSQDAVGAPIFYREVNLPFEEAVKDPAAHIRWRFGPISSTERPPVVLDKLPVCGNCHSFSSDGAVLGMDVDYGSDHGSYVICPVSSKMVFDRSKIITWSDFEPDVNRGTFGLLSQISPDRRYVLSTVKDRSVFLPMDDLAFSQLFFPVQGIVAYYDRQAKTFHALGGADDERYVQSNPTWSPDGEHVLFARAEAFHSDALSGKKRRLLKGEDLPQFAERKEEFKFDLWRVPFNGGKGGRAEPLKGASNNGMSNYFPKYSPDGKWIVFCKAKSYMLLQPDSELYIIPAEGGDARRLECNTARMNSWHSWSPNGRWLVFSSKASSPYTQLFLTHIDSEGRSTPPVVLSHFTANDMAANIPEFVNAPPDAICEIHDEFVDESTYLEAGTYSLFDGDYDMALENIQKSLDLDPHNPDAYCSWAVVLMVQGEFDEARQKITQALAIDPEHKESYCTLGQILRNEGSPAESAAALRKALDIDPEFASAHAHLGAALMDMGRTDEGRRHLETAIRIDPADSFAHRRLGIEARRSGDDAQAAEMFRLALEKDPKSVPALLRLAVILATTTDPALKDAEQAVTLAARACDLTENRDPTALITLSEVLAAAGRFADAASIARKGVTVAEEKGDSDILDALRLRLDLYEKQAAAGGAK